VRPLRALALCIVGAGGVVLLSSCGFPHMRYQPSVRPFEREMPAMPDGVVPREGADPASSGEVPERNPLNADAETLAKGKLYYGYYCAMCHGNDGRGATPVGEAYWPRPADLSSETTQALSDGDLYRRMMTGVGHDPVMKSTVARDRRWPIVAFVRTLRPPDAGR
jgi:mono/diheme cytochrome c family protein